MSGEFVDEFFSRYLGLLFRKLPRSFSSRCLEASLCFPQSGGYRKNSLLCPQTPFHQDSRLDQCHDVVGDGRSDRSGERPNPDRTSNAGRDRPFHDQNRIPVSGRPTFDRIIAVVRKLIELNVHVSLRVHIHHGRLQSARDLVDYLENEKILGHPQVKVYFSPISTYGSEMNSPEETGMFERLFQEVAEKTKNPPSNYDYMNGFLDMETEKILPKVRFCGAGCDNFYILDPLGDIYACYEEAGHRERRIGALSKGKVRFFKLKEMHSKRHMLNLPECIRCSAALFCGGGCPSRARVEKGSIFESFCHQNKAFLAQTLKAFYLKKEEVKQ